jgi:hypothetical protein
MKTTPRKNKDQKLLANRSASPQTDGPKDVQKNINAPKLLSLEEIHRRAEAVTPLLKEILDYRPRPQWDR